MKNQEQKEKMRDRLQSCFSRAKFNGISKKEIADNLGISANQLSYITSNSNTSRGLSERLANQLSSYFGVRKEWLLGNDDFETMADLNEYIGKAQDDYYKHTPILALLNELDYSALGTVPREDSEHGLRQLHLISSDKYIILNQNEWASFSDEIVEFIEFKLQKLFSSHANCCNYSKEYFDKLKPDMSIFRYYKGFNDELLEYLKYCKENSVSEIECPRGAAGLAYSAVIGNDDEFQLNSDNIDGVIMFVEARNKLLNNKKK